MTRGMDGLSNGLRHRRHRRGILRSCRMSPGLMPFGWPSNRRSGIRSISINRANTSRSRCRRTAPIGFINAFFAVVTGFALIWHIWWMAGLGLIGAFMTFLLFAFRDEEEVDGIG